MELPSCEFTIRDGNHEVQDFDDGYGDEFLRRNLF
jgi:hypothetical protein